MSKNWRQNLLINFIQNTIFDAFVYLFHPYEHNINLDSVSSTSNIDTDNDQNKTSNVLKQESFNECLKQSELDMNVDVKRKFTNRLT